MPETPPIFGYGTGVSLRSPEKRVTRSPLMLLLMMAVTVAIAAAVFGAFLWLATADYGSLLASLGELVGRFFASTRA
jgi:hypothetical protein